MSSQLHVVFGAGQVGALLARTLQARGHAVRVVRRSPAAVGPGIETVAGDARDPAFAARAAAGAAVVYHCMNPSAYTAAAWEAELPRQGDALIGAALAAGARLVVLDCLYAYGVVDGRRTEETPLGATGPKGRVRIAWDARLRAAAREQGLRFTVGRAGDFFGPGTADHSLFSRAAAAGIAAGKAPWLVGDVDVPHAFGFVPDVVAGLVALGEAAPDVEGQVFHLPTLEVTPRALVAALAAAAGTDVRPHAVPAWVVGALAPVVPLLRELRETLYQWDRPFLVDDRRFRARFPGLARSLEEAAAMTIADARETLAVAA